MFTRPPYGFYLILPRRPLRVSRADPNVIMTLCQLHMHGCKQGLISHHGNTINYCCFMRNLKQSPQTLKERFKQKDGFRIESPKRFKLEQGHDHLKISIVCKDGDTVDMDPRGGEVSGMYLYCVYQNVIYIPPKYALDHTVMNNHNLIGPLIASIP